MHNSLPPSPIATPTESKITVAEAAQLTPSQVQELMLFAQQSEQLQPGRRFRIIVPTYIPSGFQVDEIYVEEDARRFWNYYRISYKSSNSGVCFSVYGSSGGWGDAPAKTQDIKVFSEALGIVTLSVQISDNASNSSKIYLKELIVKDQRGYHFSSPRPSSQDCKAMDAKDAVRIVESLQYLDSHQAKAKPLEAIRKDADYLTAKFVFPLDSCGDKLSGSSDRWYPVLIDGTYVSSIQRQYCKDAISKEKSQYYFETVQVGSFTSYERALEFAKAVGGRVGKPRN